MREMASPTFSFDRNSFSARRRSISVPLDKAILSASVSCFHCVIHGVEPFAAVLISPSAVRTGRCGTLVHSQPIHCVPLTDTSSLFIVLAGHALFSRLLLRENTASNR